MAYTTMYVYTANGKPLNMRDAPSIIGTIMTQIPNGAPVHVNDAYDDSWYSVSYNGYTGYCMSRYLVSGWPTPTPYATPVPTYYPLPTVTPTPYGAFPNDIFFGFPIRILQSACQAQQPGRVC